MPPPPPASASSMRPGNSSSLRPARAAQRYRPGQAPKGYPGEREDQEDDDDDDDEGDEEQGIRKSQKSRSNAAATRVDGLQIIGEGQSVAGQQQQQQHRPIKVQVTKQLGQRRQESSSSSSEEDESEEERKPAAKPTYRAPGATAVSHVAKKEPANDDDEETSSEEEDSSDEDEHPPPAPLYKPVFVSKRNRDTVQKDSLANLDPDEAELKRQQELEERRRQSTLLAGEAIKRELSDKDKSEIMGLKEVDDTDGVDGEAEFEAWKLRELMRIKREKEVNVEKEREREEIEARRAMPEALRLKEDTERAAALRAEKMANRGQQSFLQKYYHKGAFYADDEILNRYDYTAATESAVKDASALPKMMQVRNFGKMNRTKYTHLVDQDTTDRQAGWTASSSSSRGSRQGADHLSGSSSQHQHQQGCFNCGGNHLKRDCPELLNGGPSGANASSRSRRQDGDHDNDVRHDGGWAGRRDRRRSASPDSASKERGYSRQDDDHRGRRRDADDRDRYRYKDRDRRPRSRSRSGERDDKRRRYD